MNKKILVTGSLAYDHIMFYDGIFHDIVLPEHLHNLNVCFLIKNKYKHFGGTAGNIAYNLKHIGEDCFMFGVAGNDFEKYKQWLEENTINTDHVFIIKEKSTASAFITTDKNGNQISNFHPGAMEETPEMNLEPLKEHISVAIISPDNTTRMLNFAEQCRKHEIPYVFDPGQNLPAIPENDLKTAISGAHVLILNEYELELLLDKINMTKKHLFDYVDLLITTRGEKGSTIENSERKEEIDIAIPSKIADPTGCGDAYRAGILQGIKENYSWKKMGQIAALISTYNLEHEGTQNHSFSAKDFAERYEESFGEKL